MARSERFVDVEVAGGSLAVVVRGEPATASACFVMLHGAADNGRLFSVVADRLPPTVATLAPDLRGRGASAGLGGPWDARSLVDDIVAVVAHFGLDQVGVVAVGSSLSLIAPLDAAAPGVVAVSVAIEGRRDRDPAIDLHGRHFSSREDALVAWKHHALMERVRWGPGACSFVDHGLVERTGTAQRDRRVVARADDLAVESDLDRYDAAVPATPSRRIIVGSAADRALAGGPDRGVVFIDAPSATAALLTPSSADAIGAVLRSLLSSPG